MVNIHELVERNGAGPFEWGENDCLTFCANVVQDIKGRDYMAAFRGYRGALPAARLLKQLGGIEKAVTSQLGEPCPLANLRKGDVAMADVGDGDALGVVCGTTIAFKGKTGLLHIPIHAAKKGWQV